MLARAAGEKATQGGWGWGGGRAAARGRPPEAQALAVARTVTPSTKDADAGTPCCAHDAVGCIRALSPVFTRLVVVAYGAHLDAIRGEAEGVQRLEVWPEEGALRVPVAGGQHACGLGSAAKMNRALDYIRTASACLAGSMHLCWVKSNWRCHGWASSRPSPCGGSPNLGHQAR